MRSGTQQGVSSLPAPGFLWRNMVTIYVALSRCDPASSPPGPFWGKGVYSNLLLVQNSVASGQPILDSPSLAGSIFSGQLRLGLWGPSPTLIKCLPIMLLGGWPFSIMARSSLGCGRPKRKGWPRRHYPDVHIS